MGCQDSGMLRGVLNSSPNPSSKSISKSISQIHLPNPSPKSIVGAAMVMERISHFPGMRILFPPVIPEDPTRNWEEQGRSCSVYSRVNSFELELIKVDFLKLIFSPPEHLPLFQDTPNPALNNSQCVAGARILLIVLKFSFPESGISKV